MRIEMEKTYKRETALTMISAVFAGHIWGVWNDGAADAARYLTMPTFIFLGGAFGLDAFAKQINGKG